MKKGFRKLTAFILTLFIGFGLCTITGDNQAIAVADKPAFVMANIRENEFQYGLEIPESKGTASAVSLPAGTELSSNWAGYIDTPASGGSYTSVSASWTIPDIADSSEGSVAAQWVGLGGVSTNDLLQIGTIEYMNDGEACYKIFYEQLPDVAQMTVDIAAGSTITASVSKSTDSSDIWNLTYTVEDTNGDTETNTIPITLDSSYAEGIGTSAEWISEDPMDGTYQLYPLAGMGTITYTSATVNGEALNASDNTVQPVALVFNNGGMTYPSSVGSDGMSFSTEISDESYGTGTDNKNSNSGSGIGPLGFDPSNSNSSGQYPSDRQGIHHNMGRGIGNGKQIDRWLFSNGIPGYGMR